jgi:hypothetical protein
LAMTMKLEFSPSVSSRDTVKRLAFNPITGRDPQLLKIHVAKPPTVSVSQPIQSETRYSRTSCTPTSASQQAELPNRAEYMLQNLHPRK